jgi:hypothetical protein
MLRKILLLLLPAIVCINSYAQTDSSHLRISLLTCGSGPEIWETFGHTAVRVVDSATGVDDVYNYGTFNGFEKDFEIKFMRGKLLYYVSSYGTGDFMQEYAAAHRKVEEQVLLFTGAQKKEVYEFLRWNALPANRDYKYDFLFDNCATRIRDVFPKSLGESFRFGNALPGKPMTFRQIINRYFYRVHFERFGVNLLLGSRVDKAMTNDQIMFLPDYLRDGVAGARVAGRPVAAPPVLLLDGSDVLPAGVNYMLVLTVVLALLTIAGLFVPGWAVLGRVMSSLLLLVTGLLGCLMLFMWLGTDHQACQDNFNILWALPTNLLVVFTRKKGRGKYALVAILFIIISLLLHVLRIQELPILELSPLLLALLCVYGTIYKRSKTAPAI